MNPAPKLLVFDLDGTLVDSFPGLRVAVNRALADFGRPEVDLEWVRTHVGRGSLVLIRAAAAGVDDVEALHEKFLEHYGATMVANTRPYPGVDEALHGLRPHLAMAVASNKPLARTEELVASLGWSSMMTAVVGPETAGTHKPDPAMIRHVLDNTGVAAAEALLVGDMPIDAETGRNAGIDVVGVTTGSASRDELLAAGCVAALDAISELPAYLGVS